MKPGDDAPIQLWVSVDTTLARTTPPRHAMLFISGVQSGYSRSSAATHETKSLCSSVFLSTTTTLRRRSFWRSARPFAGVPCSQPPSHPSTPTTTRHHETARRQGSELGAAAQRAAADTGTCARWGGARWERGMLVNSQRAIKTRGLLVACARYFGSIARRSSATEPITPGRARMLVRDGTFFGGFFV